VFTCGNSQYILDRGLLPKFEVKRIIAETPPRPVCRNLIAAAKLCRLSTHSFTTKDLAQRPCLDPSAVRRSSARYAASLSERLHVRPLPRQLALQQRTGGGATRRRLARARSGHAFVGHIQKLRKAGIGYRAIAATAGPTISTVMAMILTGERLQIRKHNAERILTVDRKSRCRRRPCPGRPNLGAAQRVAGSGLYQGVFAKHLGSRAKRRSLQIETHTGSRLAPQAR